MMKKLSAFLLASAILLCISFPAAAENSDVSETESSYSTESSSEQTSYEESNESSYYDESSSYDESSYESYNSDSSEYSYDESDYYDDNSYDESSYEYENRTYYEDSNDSESSYEEDDDDDDEESEYSSDESSYEETDYTDETDETVQDDESEISVADPFAKLHSMNYILPADDPNFVAKQKKDESSILGKTSRSELMNTPPVPLSESNIDLQLTEDDDTAMFTGIIIWSVIGILVTVLLILIINFNTGSKYSYSKKRYYRSDSRFSHKKYKYTGKH